MKQTGFALLAICLFAVAVAAQGRRVAERFRELTRASPWRQTAAQPLQFNTHHPQGLVKIGETFYLSSVEVTQPTRRFAEPQNGLDRDAGAGVGHLFKFDAAGNLLADLTLGEGAIYHPGGIDFDGRHIWVSVAEYRPNSRSIVYRVDPAAMKATEIFRYPDHLGGIVHDPETRTLHGVSWGSRRFYRWRLDGRGRVTNADAPPARLGRPNPSFYIDYQDCKFLGRREMLCGGVSNYAAGAAGNAGARFSLGGLELVDLSTGQAIHQLPLELRTASGLPMTQNPFWIEPTARGLRVWFLPEDRQSTLYSYETSAKPRE
ncbi:MAG: DUF6454 family protein [Blastocatellia bacterium]|nr:DUF6454 family protein [Blastocatellia bacterium]